jgi:NTP pyrophosphatase (non-canonical NTP hydrolase)
MSFSGLSDGSQERLHFVMEEAAEVIQACAKILRHGNHSRNPDVENSLTNKEHLSHELGQLMCVVDLMTNYFELDDGLIHDGYAAKERSLLEYSHHQSP